MKKLFIYYSMTSNGDAVSDVFKDKGYDIRKVISKTKYSKKMFMLMMKGGYRATFNKCDELEDFNSDVSAYDKIVIASPIWNDRLTPAINSVLKQIDLKDKDVSFVLYSGGGSANKAKEKIKELYGVDAIVLKQPKSNKEELDKLKDF